MNHHAPTPSSEGIRQSSGYDPRTTKRHSGLFSFFKWFKTSTSRESIDTENSSSSCESLNSVRSSGTVASFSYVPPGDYNKEQVGEKKCISLGPETDTYKARLKQRDKRRESDKNLTLRKKYNLFFNRDTLLRRIVSKKSDEDNTKSLPLMTRTDDMELIEEEKFHRRTNSESSKIKKAGAYLHVKGKRKAPQPPKENPSTSSLRRKKRLAPSPPSKKSTSVEEEKYTSINYADADIICNDSLKLDHGILKPAKEIGFNKVSKSSSDQNVPNLYSKKSSRCSYVEPPVSPRPWYKRHSNRDSLYGSRDDNKYEPIEKLPEVPFKRSSIVDLYEETKIEKKREEKRKSGLTFLTNISELDREASEIVRKEYSKNESDVVSELPEFMKPKPDSSKVNTDSWVSPKRRSAKDLIAKFNAITSVTKVTVNSAFFGGGLHQKDKHLFGNGKSEEKKQEILLQSHKKKIEQIGKKNQDNAAMMNPILKSESTSAIKVKPDTPKSERKPWNCPKCGLQNDYWRIICYVCSAIKPYFDDIATPNNNNKNDNVKKSPILRKITPPKINPPVGFLERSKTQIGFSALASYNNNNKHKNNDDSENYKQDDKKEEREKLKKMLIDMKNSLPKRKSELKKQNNRTSIILEKSERDIEQIKMDTSQQPNTMQEKEHKIAEVIIATTETVYENIKVRKTETENSNKVSASAQTNPIKNKQASPETAEDKNGFELMRAKDFEDIYSDQNSKSAARIYANLARNDELSLFFNMAKPSDTPTGFDRTETRNNTDTIEINRLLKRLENAIAKGELTEASIFAKELAQLKVNCSVVRQKSNSPPKTIEVGFSIEMYVEDKLSHRGPFSIQVTEKQTLLELKRQVQKEFEIPVEVQRWILGKELATNDEYTLKKYNITQGCPIFLYLVAPENKSPVVNMKRPATETANQGSSKAVEDHETELIPKTIEKIVIQKNPEPVQEKTSAPKIVSVIPKVVESISREQQKLNSGRAKLNEIKLVKQKSIEIKPVIIDVSSKAIPLNNFAPELNHLDDAKPTSSKNSEMTNQTTETKSNQEMLLMQLKKDDDYDNETLKPQKEWECRLCTLLNPVTSNICAVCASLRGKEQKGKKIKKQTRDNHSDNDQTYRQLVNLDNTDIVNNVEPFECAICFLDIPPSQGVTLRECLHQFCKVCLAQTIEYTEEAEVKCPYRDDQYSCNIALQDREVKALVSPVAYEKFLAKSISQAENKIGKSFHCKSPDCKGWCIFEDNVNEFRCPVCNKINCLTCQAIHTGLNCRQYQERMKDESGTNEEARRTKEMLEEMVNKGEAIACPTCQVILMKKWGCDWLRCSMCKTEICWVTRGPRWGPAGKGDISGGCQCGVNGVKCHPQCSYCH